MGDPPKDSLSKVERIFVLANIAVGIGVTLWVIYDMKKDDPLSAPAMAMRRWRNHQATRRRRHREEAEVFELGVNLALFLEREVEKWKSTSA